MIDLIKKRGANLSSQRPLLTLVFTSDSYLECPLSGIPGFGRRGLARASER
jgi:hypothetical protein